MTIATKLEQAIAKLQALTKIDLITTWLGEIPQSGAIYFAPSQKINLYQRWQVPAEYAHTKIYLNLVWWAEMVEILINGKKVQEGDLFDQKGRILLTDDATEADVFNLEIKFTSPHHDRGALQKSEVIICYGNQNCDPYPFAQELIVISHYLPLLKHYECQLDIITEELQRVLNNPDLLFNDLANIRGSLINLLSEFFQDRKLYILGNAHIDVAWLWAIAETKDVIQRTFTSVLGLQKHYPELIFNQTTALFYQWLEQQPDLFAKIQTQVKAKTWEITGGMWVEPDCNLPSGESLIRQILYGKIYFQQQFNIDVKVAFLPDTFGFNFQLPQILAKSGYTAFVTQKLSWNDTNKFPYQVFWWQGLDGSKIFTYFCNDLGVGIEPQAIAKYASQLEQNHQIKDSMWLYGVGDHGGGPTADMLDLGREWSNSPLFMELIPTSFEAYLPRLMSLDLPTWHDELYLEFHRGTYTTKADQKLKCRQTEINLKNC